MKSRKTEVLSPSTGREPVGPWSLYTEGSIVSGERVGDLALSFELLDPAMPEARRTLGPFPSTSWDWVTLIYNIKTFG